MAAQEGVTVTDGLANVELEQGPELGLVADFGSDSDRPKALTDAVVTRHKRYTSGYLSDDFADDIDAEIKRLQLKTVKIKKRLARMRDKNGSYDGQTVLDSVARDNLSSDSASGEVVLDPRNLSSVNTRRHRRQASAGVLVPVCSPNDVGSEWLHGSFRHGINVKKNLAVYNAF